MTRSVKACVIGSGPNGLAAAIVLARAGLQVQVFEAESTVGGAVRTMELTLPGFLHDFGSAVYPFGAGSPFFSSLPLREHGLEWIHSPVPLAHPLDDGSAVVLERMLEDAKKRLGPDGKAWGEILSPFVEDWQAFAPGLLRPLFAIPGHPWLMARFAMKGLRSANSIASRFKSEAARSLFAGLAAHSFLSLDDRLSGAFGLALAICAHAVGWPIARGGAQALTSALCSYLVSLGGTIRTSSRVESLDSVSEYELVLCDLTPRQLLAISGERFSEGYRRLLRKFRYGPGAFKVDYALTQPIPWKASECVRASTVHLGGSFSEIAHTEKAVRGGKHPEHPFVILVQPSLFDRTRAPAGQHTAWAYCHVPNGSQVNMLEPLESQIERFAPGFREIVLARRVLSPADFESRDANLVGGDISGGDLNLSQVLFRPTPQLYATSSPQVFLCSSSTPPGGGVHGMCGYHAACTALARLRDKKRL
jgi:phytoene dehydrogenase-like protein